MNNKAQFIQETQHRFKQVALDVIALMDRTGNGSAINVIRYQLIKSATSAAANYRAACRARSSKEFYAKMSICIEESDETGFWLELLQESVLKIDGAQVSDILLRINKLTGLVATARSNTKVKR